jgi:prevent-host-death family protein
VAQPPVPIPGDLGVTRVIASLAMGLDVGTARRVQRRHQPPAGCRPPGLWESAGILVISPFSRADRAASGFQRLARRLTRRRGKRSLGFGDRPRQIGTGGTSDAVDPPGRGCYMGGHMAAVTQVSVRELKNQTTAILRRVEAGERVVVTKRGRVVASIGPATEATAHPSDSIYRHLQRQIEARQPGLRQKSPCARRMEFERISRKLSRVLPYGSWREMDRIAKGDRLALSRR